MLQLKTPDKKNTKPPSFNQGLKIGHPSDKFEQQANKVADNIMKPAGTPQIQMMCAGCEEEQLQMKPEIQQQPMEEEEEMVQMKPNSESTQNQPISSSTISDAGSGNSLPADTRSFMETRMNTDFSSVRIHNDKKAWEMNSTLGAQAFTYGNNIYFNEGKYNPQSSDGKKLLAHELTHTIQQSGGETIRRSCDDGACGDCEGGTKSLWVTVFFRRRATRETMDILREKINKAKEILKLCCINLYFDFNWTLLPGDLDFEPGTARPAGAAEGAWDYPEDAETLGEGETFSGARGVPMLIVDNVPDTGGGVTVSEDYDTDYESNSYFVIPIDHGKMRAIAHELGHVAGILSHTGGPNVMDSGTDTSVYPAYCTAMRGLSDIY